MSNVSTLPTLPHVLIVFNLSALSELLRSCVIVSNMPLVTTGQAAKALGIGASTLAHWWADGKVKPAFITAGGHARWDLEDLKRQIEQWRQAERDE